MLKHERVHVRASETPVQTGRSRINCVNPVREPLKLQDGPADAKTRISGKNIITTVMCFKRMPHPMDMIRDAGEDLSQGIVRRRDQRQHHRILGN